MKFQNFNVKVIWQKEEMIWNCKYYNLEITQSFKPQHTWSLILQPHHFQEAPLQIFNIVMAITQKSLLFEIALAQVVEILVLSTCWKLEKPSLRCQKLPCLKINLI